MSQRVLIMKGEQVFHHMTLSRRRRSRSKKSLRQWEGRIKYRRGTAKGPKNPSNPLHRLKHRLLPNLFPALLLKWTSGKLERIISRLHLFQPRGRLKGQKSKPSRHIQWQRLVDGQRPFWSDQRVRFFPEESFSCRRHLRNIRVAFDGLQGREARTAQGEHLGNSGKRKGDRAETWILRQTGQEDGSFRWERNEGQGWTGPEKTVQQEGWTSHLGDSTWSRGKGMHEDMPKLEESPKKRLSVTNKFSSLMDEDDDENTSQTENKGIEEPAGKPFQQSFRQKHPFSNQILLEKKDAQRPPEVHQVLTIYPIDWTQHLGGRCHTSTC